MRERGLAFLACLALGACASRPGHFYQDDGPPEKIPPGLAQAPDAVPRVEALIPRANRPYSALGRSYTPDTSDAPFEQRGMASWYGRQYHGNPTASGEPYDMFAMSAAHPTLPIPSYARVTRTSDGRSVIVRINDRGPFLQDRVIDLSYAAAARLGIVGPGSAEVTVRKITARDIAAGTYGPAGARPTPDAAVAAGPAPTAAEAAPTPTEVAVSTRVVAALPATEEIPLAPATSADAAPADLAAAPAAVAGPTPAAPNLPTAPPIAAPTAPHAPAPSEPAAAAPAPVAAPTVAPPSAAQPAVAPSAAAPSSVAPSSVAPSSAAPSSVAPSSVAPSSVAPSSAPPPAVAPAVPASSVATAHAVDPPGVAPPALSPPPAATAAPAPPGPVAAPLPAPAGATWAVQLGAFAQAANAEALREQVRALLAGPGADALPAANRAVRIESDGRLHRVLVGGFEQRAAAQDSARQLKAFLGRDTTVYRSGAGREAAPVSR